MGAAYDMAVILYRQKRYDIAREKLSRELAEQPNNPNAHAMLALCLTGQGQFRDARRYAEQAIALDPLIAFTHFALAWVFFNDRQFSCRRRFAITGDEKSARKKCLLLARKSADEAIRLSPLSDAHYGLLGWISYELEDYAGASHAALLGLEITPNSDDCLRLRAHILQERGDFAAALQASEAALSSAPERALSHVMHGRSLVLSGDWQTALIHFREAMRIDPNSATAKHGLIVGLCAQNPIYRLFVISSQRPSITRPAQLVSSVLILCAVLGPPILTMSLCSRNPRVEFFTLLAATPGIMLITSPLWTRSLLQFKHEGKHLFSRRARGVLTATVIGALSALSYAAFNCIASPSPHSVLPDIVTHFAGPGLLLSAGAILINRALRSVAKRLRTRTRGNQP